MFISDSFNENDGILLLLLNIKCFDSKNYHYDN